MQSLACPPHGGLDTPTQAFSVSHLAPAESMSLMTAQAWGPQKTKLTLDDFGAKAGGIATKVDVRALRKDKWVIFIEE